MEQQIKRKFLLILHKSHYPLTQRSDELLYFLSKDRTFDSRTLRITYDYIGLETSYIPTLPGCIKGIRAIVSTLVSVFKLWPKKTAVDICWAGDVLPAFIGTILKRLGFCKKLVYDDEDYCPILYSGLTSVLIGIFERIIITNADLIISVSEELAKIRKSQKAKCVEVIPHGVDYELFKKSYEIRLRRIYYTNFRPKVMVYAGNYSDVLKEDLLLQALAKLSLKGTDFRFVLVGSGNRAILDKFLGEARRMGVDSKVAYIGPVPRTVLPLVYAEADIGLCKLTPTYLKVGTTKKLLEYMASGLPVIVSRMGPAARLVEEAHAGFVTTPVAENLSEAFLSALNLTKHEYLEMSGNAVAFAKNYDWKLLWQRYRELIQTYV